MNRSARCRDREGACTDPSAAGRAVDNRGPGQPPGLSLREAGISRPVLAARFRQCLGEPPVAYLTRWRLQLGAQMLSSTSHSVAQIASKVGYDSEQAFNRAFKRNFGNPPARYRNETKSKPKQSQSSVSMTSA